MFINSLFLCLVLITVVISETCYWNRECPYQYYSSKTPYDTVRGDIRDHPMIEGCEAISIWVLNRHGNRNPGTSVTTSVQTLSQLKDEIISSHEAGRGQLCAQDIDLFKNWTWNSTLETSTSYLTGVGYEEIYDIAYRIREKYPYLFINSTADLFYVRPTNEQRTIVSAAAFINGLMDGTNLTLTAEDALTRDDVVRPYENCERYQAEVRTASNSTLVDDQIAKYMATEEFQQIRAAVTQRLGISTQISAENIYEFYELCRFDRSWSEKMQSPWCAVFSDQDLVVLEYRDDVRHYYRNGYGHWTNPRLGGVPLHDLFNTFQEAQLGNRTLTTYFTHDTMLEMTFAALGLYKDDFTLYGDNRNENRKWRSSLIGAFSTNIIAVLNRCNLPNEDYKVQFFINEKETEVCPASGCSWSEFYAKFSGFSNSLDFCRMDYPAPETFVSSGLRIEMPILSLIMTILLSYFL